MPIRCAWQAVADLRQAPGTCRNAVDHEGPHVPRTECSVPCRPRSRHVDRWRILGASICLAGQALEILQGSPSVANPSCVEGSAAQTGVARITDWLSIWLPGEEQDERAHPRPS